MYGWAGISGSILTTSPEQGGAGLSPALTIHIFSLSTSIGCFSQVPLGLINDKFGPRFCSILSNTIAGLGSFIFVFSDTWKRISNSEEENTSFYTAGAILMAFGQPGVQVPLVHLGNLFPGRENSVISLITSTLSISFVVFPMFSSIWSLYHIDFRLLFRLLGWTIWALALISSYLWPDSPYEKQTPMTLMRLHAPSNDGTAQGEEGFLCTTEDSNSASSLLDQHHGHYYNSIHHHRNEPLDSTKPLGAVLQKQPNDSFKNSRIPMQLEQGVSSNNSTLRDQLLSTKMARLTLYFIIAWFWGDMYVATLPVELKDQRYFDAETNNHLVQSFSYISSLGMFVSPLVGYSIDKFGSSYTCAATFALGVFQMILLLLVPLFITYNIPSLAKSLLVANFIMNNLFRTFLYPCFYSSLTEFFGLHYIGILSGIIVFIFGIAFLFLVPLGEQLALGTCHLYSSNDENGIGTHTIYYCYYQQLFFWKMVYTSCHSNDFSCNVSV
jgi:Major Facilitator Superfamily.